MERSLAVKENAIGLLDKQLSLRAKKNQYGIIVVSSATEPYLQFEDELEMTRKILERILHYRFPVHIITRSNLVTRDFDILHAINQQAKAFITFSFSTLDDGVAKIFEPGATPPSQRLECLKQTIDAGFHSGVSLMPLLPFISDTSEQLDNFYSTFSNIGVKYIFPASIHLFGEGPADSKTLTLRAIEKHFPSLADQYRRLDYSYQKSFRERVSFVQKEYNIPDRIVY
jgi:DNA repair photolyase